MKILNSKKIVDNNANNNRFNFIQRFPSQNLAFTLAEVLITLGIIGIVAEATIPTIVHDTNLKEYKVAYKKAYADFAQVFVIPIAEHSFEARTNKFDETASASEWQVIKSGFKVTKDCNTNELYSCWVDADKVLNNNYPATDRSLSFIDASGRSWVQYNNTENIYLVDTNGAKGPNRFGKDRWIFTLLNADNTRTETGYPSKVATLFDDITTDNSGWCNYPPCYYKSWLIN